MPVMRVVENAERHGQPPRSGVSRTSDYTSLDQKVRHLASRESQTHQKPCQFQLRRRNRGRCAASANRARPANATPDGSATTPGGSGCVV
jgi:hypothetical protein